MTRTEYETLHRELAKAEVQLGKDTIFFNRLCFIAITIGVLLTAFNIHL